MSCACVVLVVCACVCSMCVYDVIMNSCDDACWILCVVLMRCLMRPRVVCDVVWLYGLLFVFVLLCVCVPCLRVCM